MLKLVVATLLFGVALSSCNSTVSISNTTSSIEESDAACDDASSEEECDASTAGQSIKLQTDSCIDPDLEKLAKGVKMMLCDGTMAEGKLDLSNLTAGNIKRGVTINGVAGAFPSATYPLPRFQTATGSDVTVAASDSITSDLTDLSSQLTSAGDFEFWDKNGQRYTGSGDNDISAANVKNGVNFENIGVSGSFAGTYPSASQVESGVQFGPSGTDYTGTKPAIRQCKNGKGITASGGNTTTPWDDGQTNGDDSVDDFQDLASPWYTGADRTDCNETNFTDVTGGTNLVPDDSLRVTAGGDIAWTKIIRDDLTGLYFTNVLGEDDGSTDKTWSESLDLCAGLNGSTAGSGWRLPTEKELLQLHIDGIARNADFGDTGHYFWSSTTRSSSTSVAWAVGLGNANVADLSKTGPRAVVCMRE